MIISPTDSAANGETPRTPLGFVEWFRPGEEDRVASVLAAVRELGVEHLRIGFSWADYHRPEGKAWYDWLVPTLAAEVELLPCLNYTPPSIAEAPRTSAPPQDLKAFADFTDEVIRRYGEHFEWVELWNEPNNHVEWDFHHDPGWAKFAEMIGMAAHWAKQCGKKVVLGGVSPIEGQFFWNLAQRGVLQHLDAVSVHGFPETWDHQWQDWREPLKEVRDVLDQSGNSHLQLWITEAGYSTWRHDEFRQLQHFLAALHAPADRLYWYSLDDLDPNLSHQDGFHADERHYHFGLRRDDGSPKLLYRLWASEGLEAVAAFGQLPSPQFGHEARADRTHHLNRSEAEEYVLVFGGSGFIGSNVAEHFLNQGEKVLVFDNLSRAGAENNLNDLLARYGDRLRVELSDVRNRFAVADAVAGAKAVFNFSAQVAVTTSLVNPRDDFEINVGGTLNILEAIRQRSTPVPIIFTSTNKVYGGMEDVVMEAVDNRYRPVDRKQQAFGEDRPLDFHSPYGCSKGAADQYILDYARSFGIPATVFRLSCIYGPHQHGNEDQGWVAHFIRRTLAGEPITLYGDGKQVRDILYVGDLVRAFSLALNHPEHCAGHAFNLGGGRDNSISLIQLLDYLSELHGQPVDVNFGEWRTGDQRYYVTDHSRFSTATDWRPEISWKQGVAKLYRWLERRQQLTSPVSTLS
ncbi:MAG: NAD-dependent epimerase/dehydratase family protein [Verrucomicrobiota bacterium JB022]|nr:NAD-dependent epimerase/dehydratase family protein [Verrucomicrobiota bacterium JB022]